MDPTSSDPTPPAPAQPPAPEPPPAAQPAAPPATEPPPPPPSAAPPVTAAWASPPEPAGPAPGFQFAPHGGRLVSHIIDLILIGILVTLLSLIAVAVFLPGLSGDLNDPDSLTVSGSSVAAALVVLLIILVISLGYFPWFWMRGGQTPGMRPFHLRVVRDRDGGPVGGGQALLRLVGYWISQTVFYLGFAWILIDSRRRGWADLLAGTVVVEIEQ